MLKEYIKIKCKYGHDNNSCETCGVKYKDCEQFLEQTSIKHDLREYKCLCCNKNYQKKRFANTCNFANHDINKFILLLRKGVYLYEYMDDSEKFNEP